jgi:hypothetical protein
MAESTLDTYVIGCRGSILIQRGRDLRSQSRCMASFGADDQRQSGVHSKSSPFCEGFPRVFRFYDKVIPFSVKSNSEPRPEKLIQPIRVLREIR